MKGVNNQFIMVKKILFLAVVFLSVCASAQNAVGDWRIHSSFVGNNIKMIAEGNKWVYYLSGGNLFRLDKETQENESLSKVNDLSDMIISNAYYNDDQDYLVVVYTNSNIDVILSNGSVVNMSEIKDAVMTQSKTINDVSFAPGRIYVACDFGYVVIDESKFVVKESLILGEKVTSVAQLGEWLLLSTPAKSYYGLASDYHEHLASFDRASFKEASLIRPINDETFFCLAKKETYLVNAVPSQEGKLQFDTITILNQKVRGANVSQVQATDGGFILNSAEAGRSFKTDQAGVVCDTIGVEGEICAGHPSGGGQMWAVGAHGLHQLNSVGYYVPNAPTMPMPFWMTYNKERDLLYVSSTGTNYFFEDNAYPIQVNTYDGIKWTDVTPEDAPNSSTRGSYWLDFMPGDPDTYLLSTWRNGLLKVKDNKVVYVYDYENSPMLKKYAVHPITRIDRNGNVWAVEPLYNEEHPVMVLPAAKSKLDEVTVSDWITPSIDGIYTGSTSKRASFISTRNSQNDIKIFTDGDYQRPLFFWNSAGEISDHPQQAWYAQLPDQDGEIVSWTNIMCLTEDNNGNVWMGTTEGVCVFNPANAFNVGAFNVVRPKVPRNDGTGMADRLMDGIQVNDVAVDGANRKWLATNSSGLFLVSSDGTEIIRKFNTTNSPLASNTVYRVCCNPSNNSVYVATPAGLYEYFSDSSPAQPTYENIYAYPNPVRPDYGGDVTVTGMMDNSLVKIADASGQVIRQLKSTGGMATWDCCDQNGERVKTGVYFVLCSQANGSGEAVVTKIAVIR